MQWIASLAAWRKESVNDNFGSMGGQKSMVDRPTAVRWSSHGPPCRMLNVLMTIGWRCPTRGGVLESGRACVTRDRS